MASRAALELPLNDSELTEAWLRGFAATARTKKLTDTEEAKQVTDLFLSKAGMEALRQVSIMAAPLVLEDTKFEDIHNIIMEKMQPKKRLVVAERTRFLATRQGVGENVRRYVQRLREAAKFCNFKDLNAQAATQTAEDELILMRLVDGLVNSTHRIKLLEFMQSATTEPSLDNCVQFAQQLEMIQSYHSKQPGDTDGGHMAEITVSHVDRNKTNAIVKDCKFCGKSHARGKCPAFGKTCNKCRKQNHFSVVCRSATTSAKRTHEVEVSQQGETEAPADFQVFSLGSTKRLLKKVTINEGTVLMQLDSGSEATILPKNLWESIGQPKLRPTKHRLRQFDGSEIRTIGQFEGLVEMEKNYAIANIIVAECGKAHGLLGTDVLSVDASSMAINCNKEGKGYQESFVHWAETDVISMEELRRETSRDSVLSGILRRVSNDCWGGCSVVERPFKSVRQCLSVEGGILCRGDLLVPPSVLRPRMIEAVHNDVHGGVTATRNRLKLEAWWPGYCDDVERFVGKCARCNELKPAPQRHLHTWPEESEPWARVHIDHGHVPNIGLILILVDANSGWPEVVRVPDRRAETVKRVLRLIFARNGVPRTLVSDNAAEFTDSDLCAWLERIGCRPLKTPPYHPQSNGAAERMVQTIKRGLKAFNKERSTFEAYMARLLLAYRSVPHAGRAQSPSAMMGRQLRSPITTAFETDECLWYRRPGQSPEAARFLMQSGHNSALVVRGEEEAPALAHLDQLRRRVETVAPGPATQNATREPFHTEAVVEQSHPGADEGNGAAPQERQEPRRSSRPNKGIPPVRFGEDVVTS